MPPTRRHDHAVLHFYAIPSWSQPGCAANEDVKGNIGSSLREKIFPSAWPNANSSSGDHCWIVSFPMPATVCFFSYRYRSPIDPIHMDGQSRQEMSSPFNESESCTFSTLCRWVRILSSPICVYASSFGCWESNRTSFRINGNTMPLSPRNLMLSTTVAAAGGRSGTSTLGSTW
jgi:hypothetical protein